MISTGNDAGKTGVGRCFVKAFFYYDSILRKDFDALPQTIENLNKIHAVATNAALIELKKLHQSCDQHPDAFGQHHRQLMKHIENAFELRQAKIEQIHEEREHQKAEERKKLKGIGTIIRQNPQEFDSCRPILADYQIEHNVSDSILALSNVKQASPFFGIEKPSTEDENPQTEGTNSEANQAKSDALTQHYEQLMKSQLEKIAQLEKERDQDAQRRKAEFDTMKSEMELLRANLKEQSQEAKRKETECKKLKAEMELLTANLQSLQVILETNSKLNQELKKQQEEQKDDLRRKEEQMQARLNELRQKHLERENEILKQKEEQMQSRVNELRQEHEVRLRDRENQIRQQNEERLRVLNDEIRQLNAKSDQLSELQQRVNRNRTRRLEILTKIEQLISEMKETSALGIASGVVPFVGLIAGVPTAAKLSARFETLKKLTAELREID